MKITHAVIGSVLIIAVVLAFALGKLLSFSTTNVLEELFAYPDGTPCQQACILGIEPGVTTPPQAMELMDAHKLTRGRVVWPSAYSGRDYLNVKLQRNALSVEVDYNTNQVLSMRLTSPGIDGLGFTGMVIGGRSITWNDMQAYLGSPDRITGAAGEGGEISLAAALYDDEGWCIEAPPYDRSSLADPLTIPLDSRIYYIEIHCPFLKVGGSQGQLQAGHP